MFKKYFLTLYRCFGAGVTATFMLLLADATALAGEVRSGPGAVFGKQNSASVGAGAGEAVLDYYDTAIEVMRSALKMPAPTVVTSSTSRVTSIIGMIGGFALEVAMDEDARSGVQVINEIHREDSASGIKAGSAGHYARSAGFSNEEFAELMGWEQ